MTDKLESKVETYFYTIKCITNLHVGTNNSNYGIIDNEVQKDEITNIPIINSSSIKGALREFFEVDMNKNNSNMVTWIFGPKQSKDKTSSEGNYKFFQADLLARPVRSNKKPFFLVLAPMVIESFLSRVELMKVKLEKKLEIEFEALKELKVENNKAYIFEDVSGVILEDIKADFNNTSRFEKIKEFLGNKNIALISDDDFKNLDLPVIARNHLEDGKSKNLWYEEIVPRESIFYFFVTRPTNIEPNDEDNKINPWKDQFNNSINSNNVQFGGNKSIGYGFCEVKKVY